MCFLVDKHRKEDWKRNGVCARKAGCPIILQQLIQLYKVRENDSTKQEMFYETITLFHQLQSTLTTIWWWVRIWVHKESWADILRLYWQQPSLGGCRQCGQKRVKHSKYIWFLRIRPSYVFLVDTHRKEDWNRNGVCAGMSGHPIILKQLIQLYKVCENQIQQTQTNTAFYSLHSTCAQQDKRLGPYSQDINNIDKWGLKQQILFCFLESDAAHQPFMCVSGGHTYKIMRIFILAFVFSQHR